MGRIAANIAAVVERAAEACRRSGRTPEEVRLMVVTKTQPRKLLEESYAAGIRLFGENRIAEAEEKFRDFYPDAELHMIGHLQRNKVNRAVELVRCVQSIDKLETAAALDRRCGTRGTTMEVLLEVNTSGEQSKEGFRSHSELFSAIEKLLDMENIRIKGLMTIATFTDDEQEIRRCFSSLAGLRSAVQRRFELHTFTELSMGMTNDFEIAIEEGSTLIRVGSAVFGPRVRP
jgi:pyridoxal phosphate enzyme (YggS family)